jgi:hypothetical protein
MGKSGPKAPDYSKAAREQSQGQQDLLMQQTAANRPDQYTPWGSSTWTSSQSTDPRTGKPVTSWSNQLNLDPRLQQILDTQFGIQGDRSNLAQDLFGQVEKNYSQPFSFGGLPQGGKSFSAADIAKFSDMGSDKWRQKAQDAAWKLQKPMLDQDQGALESQLANMGLSRGSEAWNAELRRMGDQRNRAQLQAIESGRAEADLMGDQAQRNFGMQLQGQNFNNSNRAQALDERLTQRSLPMQEMLQLLQGQGVQMPGMQDFTQAGQGQAPDLMGAATQQYGANVDKYNARQANLNNAASMAMSYFMFSDARLKEDIQTVGYLPNGLRIVTFRFIGGTKTFLGVIAQEALKIIPDAVRVRQSGFMMVDYSKVFA